LQRIKEKALRTPILRQQRGFNLGSDEDSQDDKRGISFGRVSSFGEDINERTVETKKNRPYHNKNRTTKNDRMVENPVKKNLTENSTKKNLVENLMEKESCQITDKAKIEKEGSCLIEDVVKPKGIEFCGTKLPETCTLI